MQEMFPNTVECVIDLDHQNQKEIRTNIYKIWITFWLYVGAMLVGHT